MLRNLLVPLDGSDLAEAALPAACCLAVSIGAKITLLHIIEEHAPESVHDHHHLSDPEEARHYLDQVAQRLVPESIVQQKHVHDVHTTDVAQGIVAHVEELAPDLVIMCAHGRMDLQRMLYGSLAQQVLASGRIPVLLVPRGHELMCQQLTGRTILVPLDGAAEHEIGLSLISEIAQASRARLHLFTVVQTVSSLKGERAAAAAMLPATANVMLSIEQENAESYLADIARRLKDRGIEVETSIGRGKRVETIVQKVADLKADMIALTTHGHKGTRAFWTASVAPRVLEKASVPVLLIPAEPQQ